MRFLRFHWSINHQSVAITELQSSRKIQAVQSRTACNIHQSQHCTWAAVQSVPDANKRRFPSGLLTMRAQRVNCCSAQSSTLLKLVVSHLLLAQPLPPQSIGERGNAADLGPRGGFRLRG